MSSRRPLTLLALAITSFVLAACSQVTAPRRDSHDEEFNVDGSCRVGTYNIGTGRCE